jgi:hypothetical protein
VHTALGNDIILGNIPGRDKSLGLTRKERQTHLHIVGSSGVGKTKLLENLIRQDISNWSKSKCGVLVLDPHGNLYDNLINWLAWTEFDRPIIPIDLRQDDWVVSYNLLRQRQSADPAVLVKTLIKAIAYVWGQDGTKETPLFDRWAGNVLRVLYEKNLTLLEAEHLVDRSNKQNRRALTADLRDKLSQKDWQFADTLSPKDFDTQISSTLNRFQAFIHNEMLRLVFGQPSVSLDLGRALEDGAIILVNLATKGARISSDDAELFATLLLHDLWTAAQEGHGKSDDVKPFYVYIDEFQKFVTPTIAENLDQARGFGLHLTLAHQFPLQLSNRGENGRRVFDSVMEGAQSKVVFRLSYSENLRPMADWLFQGVMNPDEVKLRLKSRKVVDYREELKEGYGVSSTWGHSAGSQQGRASGTGSGGTSVFPFDENAIPSSTSDSWSEFQSESSSESESWSEGGAKSKSFMPMLVPIFGEEVSHVQYRSLDEQLFRAMNVLSGQQERQGVSRLVGHRAPVSIYTPEVNKKPGSEERTKCFLEECYQKLPFALPSAEAQKQISGREASLLETLFKETADEPATAKQRLR